MSGLLVKFVVTVRLLSGSGFSNLGINIDAATVLVETHDTIGEREEGVVFATSDVLAWLPLGAGLTNENVACNHIFAAELLHAAALAVRIATVFNGTLSFFMSHESSLV